MWEKHGLYAAGACPERDPGSYTPPPGSFWVCECSQDIITEIFLCLSEENISAGMT